MRIVITGASSGIGRETALKLAKEGHVLVLASRSKNLLEELAGQCRKIGAPEVAVCVWDATSRDQDQLLADSLLQLSTADPIALVHSSGVAHFGDYVASDPIDIHNMVLVNLLGIMRAVRELLPLMIADKRGKIINVSSIAATNTFPGAAGYCASKTGALAFMRCIAAEVREQGIQVTSLVLGSTDTPLWKGKSWMPTVEDMLTASSVAETIADLIKIPEDRNVDEIHLLPPKGIL